MIALIDNYDSFTYNLVHYLQELCYEVEVHEAKKIGDLSQASHLLISPGSGKPQEALGSLEVIRKYAGLKPILGICLGHQCIAYAFGGEVQKGKMPIHGKTSKIRFLNDPIFRGCEQGFKVMRYHSLCVRDVGKDLEAIAWSDDGEIMALKHSQFLLYGFQFHPESILSEHGHLLLENFLNLKHQSS